MSSHSDSPLSSLCTTPTWTHAPETSNTGRHKKKKWAQCESHSQTMHARTIDALTDNVLLDIFDLVRSSKTNCAVHTFPATWKWHTLARVCRRWRQILIFASPLRLHLRLLCTHGTPSREGLDCWPTLPIVINFDHWKGLTPIDEDNIDAALEHPNRISHLKLPVTKKLLEKTATAMRGPFPVLRVLSISSTGTDVPVLPDDFLGGSAPCLRKILFKGFPASPTILSSASGLVDLSLIDMPQANWISPSALVACLAVLPRLEYLFIGFEPFVCTTYRLYPPSETRVVLPSLTSFSFVGESAYLDHLIAQIDTPRLHSIKMMYIDEFQFRVVELPKFINRSNIKPCRMGEAMISFEDGQIVFYYFFHEIDPYMSAIAIRLSTIDELIQAHVIGMAQLLSQSSAMLSDVVSLEIKVAPDQEVDYSSWQLEDDEVVDDTWLALLRPFTAVETLRVSEEIAGNVAHAFEGMTAEMATQVLPALSLLCLEDQPATTIEKLSDILRGCGLTLTVVSGGLDSEGSDSENDPYLPVCNLECDLE